MKRYALTAIGPDRPGMAAAVTEVLNRHKCSIGDSNMMTINSEFSITLIMTLPKGKRITTILKDFKELEKSDHITVNINGLPPDKGTKSPLSDFMVTLHGKNRPGIIYRATKVLAGLGVNITNLESKAVSGKNSELYLLVIEAATPEGMELKKIEGKLKALAKTLKLKMEMKPIEAYTPL
jgi:glycine cleavage system transcriptional repressor